jgi:oligosaccharide repeat unit polymerase
MLLSIFAIRPLVASGDDFDLYGLDASSGAGYAEKVGTIALVCLALGAVLARTKRSIMWPLRAEAEPSRRELRSPWAVVALAVAGGVVTVAVLALIGGSAALHGYFVSGRSAQLTSALSGLPTFVSMISFLGAAAAAVYAAVIVQSRRFTRREVAILSFGIAVSFLLNVSTGNRRALIPIILVPISVVLLARAGRLSKVILGLGVVAIFFFATLPFVRSEGARPGANVFAASTQFATANGLGLVAHDFFVSYDTEMFNYVAFVGPRLGESIPYGNGQAFFGELITFPFPASASPQDNYSDVMLQRLFGKNCAQGVCPVPSAPGVFMLDFGFLGVAVGMTVVGWFYRRVETSGALGLTPASLVAAGVVAGYAPILIRTYSPDAVWWEIYFGVLCWVSFKVLVLKPLVLPDRHGSEVSAAAIAELIRHAQR